MLVRAARRGAIPVRLVRPVSRRSEIAALSLAVCSLLLGLAALWPIQGQLLSNPLAPKELGTTVLVILGGTRLAAGLSRQALFGDGRAGPAAAGPVRRAAAAVGQAIAQADLSVRRWLFASLGLLMLAGVFASLLAAGASR